MFFKVFVKFFKVFVKFFKTFVKFFGALFFLGFSGADKRHLFYELLADRIARRGKNE